MTTTNKTLLDARVALHRARADYLAALGVPAAGQVSIERRGFALALRWNAILRVHGVHTDLDLYSETQFYVTLKQHGADMIELGMPDVPGRVETLPAWMPEGGSRGRLVHADDLAATVAAITKMFSLLT